MLLVGGLCRLSKEIHYDEQSKQFDIYNEIDDTYQSNLTEKALHTKTNIPEAINNGVFYYHSSNPPTPYISKLSYLYKGYDYKGSNIN